MKPSHSFTDHHLFQALRRFEQQYLPLDLFLSHYFRAHKSLGAKDRRTISQAVYSMTRWRSLLDHLIGPHPTWEKRYALFCGFQPDQYIYVNSIPLHIRVSCPEELFQLLKKDYGEEKATYLCQVLNTQAPTTIRINLLKTTRVALLKRLAADYEVTASEASSCAIHFKKRASLFSLPEFQAGQFELQDEASQIAASYVAVEPGEHVLDFCAGSGGKTLAFAPHMENKGQIYLHDIREQILNQARKRLRRAGIQNAQFLPPGHPQLAKLKKRMDWVLVDAPCSGTGAYRRNPDQKWRFSLEQLNHLVSEQRKIFEQALSYVKPGGKIVYVTCSLLKAENEEQLVHFLEAHPVKLARDPFVSLPSYSGMDGFFAVTLEKLDR